MRVGGGGRGGDVEMCVGGGVGAVGSVRQGEVVLGRPGICGRISGGADEVSDRRVNVAGVERGGEAAVPFTAQDARSDIDTPSSALVSVPHSAHLPAANKKAPASDT